MGNKLFCFLVSLILILVYSIYAENTPTRLTLSDEQAGVGQAKDILQQSPEQDPKEKALQQYRLILKENPNDIETNRAYQNLMRQCGGLNNLKDEYIVKLNTEPQNSLYHYLYGRLLDGKELEDAFKKAMELETKSPNQELRFWIYSGLGQFYKDTKKYKEALQNFETAQKLKPDFLDVQHQMALIYYETNNITMALNMWDKLLKIKPDYLDARLGKGVAYKSQGKYDEAIKELETILKIDEKYLKAYEPLIQCYHAKQDYKKGTELRKRIRELYDTSAIKDGLTRKGEVIIVIDIVSNKNSILIVKEAVLLPSILSSSIPPQYYFEFYDSQIDKTPRVVYLYKVTEGLIRYETINDKKKSEIIKCAEKLDYPGLLKIVLEREK